MLDSLNKYKGLSLLFVRLALGIVFLMHGVGKLFNIGPTPVGLAGFSGWLESLGVPAAGFAALVVALIETIGGLLVLVGLWTRPAALGIAVVMLVAFFMVHVSKGFSVGNGGYEFVLVLFLSALALLFGGPGETWVLKKL
ncbi:MAG TPA: DoxX family protein [Candidatus Nanoarchaeia archaeon]|nr:DoxX family protein [Candidatus Nanoarchaeia archaeon]